MAETIVRKGPRRWLRYGTQVLFAGGRGLWLPIALLSGAGLVAVAGVILRIAGVLTDVGLGWFFAAAFLVLLILALVGGYRVWSSTEHELEASRANEAVQPPVVYATGGGGGDGSGSGGGGGVGVGPGAVGEGGKGGRVGVPTVLDWMARAAYASPLPLAEFIRQQGFDSLEAVDRIGAGGDGGTSGPGGSESGQEGGSGAVLLEWFGPADTPDGSGGATSDEPTGELGEDRQIDVEPDPLDPTDTERE